jgi:nucleotide-binding universal stress UspA family protein
MQFFFWKSISGIDTMVFIIRFSYMIKKILIPTDFSASAMHALKYAIDLNKSFNARLYLLHVLQDITDFSEFNLSPTILPQLYAEFEQNATNKLEEIVNTLVPKDTACDTYIIHGVPFYEIIQFSKDEGIDLIVIGSHGRTGIKHVLFGSTAEKVIKKSICPVLTIRHPESAFEMP